MTLKPRLHDLYIARSVITSVLLTWGVLLVRRPCRGPARCG